MTPSPKTLPSIGIVGCGFVGQSLLRLFGECPVYDPAKGMTASRSVKVGRLARARGGYGVLLSNGHPEEEAGNGQEP